MVFSVRNHGLTKWSRGACHPLREHLAGAGVPANEIMREEEVLHVCVCECVLLEATVFGLF